MTAAKISVTTGSISYDILLGRGLLAKLPDLLDRYAPAHRYAVISDTTVEELYGLDVQAALGGEPQCCLFSFPPGEKNKTRATWALLTDRMLQAGFGRDSVVLALGGGVCGDLAGFVAATFMRGIPCVQVPTSLLAMIDSSVGGKTGVDTAHGKNLVGAFHRPNVVIVDGSTLETLPDKHISAGTAEAIKHAAVADASYLEWIVAERYAIVDRNVDTLVELVRSSIDIKAEVVSKDETERGRRAILNFGHTVGHALETSTDFDLLHGDAVALGMLAESELGTRIGITHEATTEALRGAIEAMRLPTRTPRVLDREALSKAMEQDKKARNGSVRFTLLERIGRVHQGQEQEWTHVVPKEAIFDALGTIS